MTTTAGAVPGVTGQHPMPANPPVGPSPAAPQNTQDGIGNNKTRNERILMGQTPVDYEKLSGLGARLASKFTDYEKHRRLIELKWARNVRQFLGEYDPEVLKAMDANRSKAYPRLTRVKCVSMLSRLMNLLFPTSEKNWTIEPSPVPNLETDDLNTVLQEAMQEGTKANKPLTDEVIEAAVRAFAQQRSDNLAREIEDQLAELGGNRQLGYVPLCRKVLMSGILYGMGILHGPFVRKQKVRTWVRDDQGNYSPQESEVFRPQFEFKSVWDYYPDLTAKHFHQMDGQFHREVMSRSQLRTLADRDDFFGNIIKKYLESNPKGNWKERSHETELRTIGTQQNVNVLEGNKYEIIVWNGFVPAAELMACGIEVPEVELPDMVDASVWLLDGRVIKCDLSPWVELEPDERVQMYHVFMFEEDDSSLVGNGLPNIMRDSQMGLAAAVRMALDNASVTCGPNLEVNKELLEPGQDDTSITPYKIWYRNGTGQDATIPAVREIKFDTHLSELKPLIDMFNQFADMETFVNPATGGDMQKGPSEPFRTAAGASMIQGQAALPFKDVVRNFDTFTISALNAIVLFNKHFNPNREVQGDHTVIARGASSLVAKEVRGMALDMMAQTMQPEERKYIKWYKLAAERLKVRDVNVADVLVTEDEANGIEAGEAQKAKEDADSMKQLLAAEVRKLLAESVKNLTAADSNAASADQKQAVGEAAKYTAILKGLVDGIAPVDVHAAHSGAEIPDELKKRADDRAAPPKPAGAAPKKE